MGRNAESVVNEMRVREMQERRLAKMGRDVIVLPAN